MGITNLATKFKDEDGTDKEFPSHISIQIVDNGFVVKSEYEEEEEIAVFTEIGFLIQYISEVLR